MIVETKLVETTLLETMKVETMLVEIMTAENMLEETTLVSWCIIKNGHSSEWTENRVTVFLKWTDLRKL